MEAEPSFKTLVHLYQTTRRQVLEGGTLCSYRCNNFISNIVAWFVKFYTLIRGAVGEFTDEVNKETLA
jgi:hypothetical protein